MGPIVFPWHEEFCDWTFISYFLKTSTTSSLPSKSLFWIISYLLVAQVLLRSKCWVVLGEEIVKCLRFYVSEIKMNILQTKDMLFKKIYTNLPLRWFNISFLFVLINFIKHLKKCLLIYVAALGLSWHVGVSLLVVRGLQSSQAQ